MTEDSPAEPVRWIDINGVKHTTPPGTMRTFGMNSKEFYDAVKQEQEPDPWGWGPRMRPTPRSWDPPVHVDHDYKGPRRR